MFKFRKVSAILSILLAMVLVLSACGTQGAVAPATTDEKEPATTAEATSEPTAEKEPPTKIRLFMSTLGTAVPEDVNPADTPFLKIIAELANVEFTEVIVPPYADYDQKLQLTVASGDMPDVMHDQWDPAGMDKLGMEGAFEPLNDYIAKSESLKQFFTDDQVEMMKASDGNIYRFNSVSSGDVESFQYRKDLVDELNGGTYPTTPEGWYDLAKKVVEKYPGSIPFSGVGIPNYWLFRSFGVECTANGQWQYTGGKYIHVFEAPLMKECMQFLKKSYDEGLLDNNFLTNTNADYGNVKYYNNLLCKEALYLNAVNDMKKVAEEKLNMVFAPGVQPVKNDSKIEKSNVYFSTGLLGLSSLLMASTSTEKEAAFRLMETFCSDEVLNLASYGREGIEYNVVDGKKVVNVEESKKTKYRWMYGIMKYYNYPDQNNVTREIVLDSFPDTKAQLSKNFDEGWAKIESNAKTIPNVLPRDVVTIDAEAATRKAEAVELGKSIICKYIIGEINDSQYDAEVTAFLEKYKDVTAAYNTRVDALRSKWGF